MTGFKPGSSGTGSDHAVNCATTNDQYFMLCLIPPYIRQKNVLLSPGIEPGPGVVTMNSGQTFKTFLR